MEKELLKIMKDVGYPYNVEIAKIIIRYENEVPANACDKCPYKPEE